jgi:gluconolactonase
MSDTWSRRAVMAGLCSAAFGGAHAQTTPPAPPVPGITRLDPALDALIAADAPIEQVMAGFVLSEGPVWIGGPDGYLLASDVRGNRILSWSPSEGAGEFLNPSGYAGAPTPMFREAGSNGLIVARGGLVMADTGNRGIARLDLKTRRKTMLCRTFEGRRFNSPNDLVLARDGAIYFTDPPFGLNGGAQSPYRELDFSAIFRLAPDNSVALAARVTNPNGLGLSPDGRTLYTTEQGAGWVALDLDATGIASRKRPFVDSRATGILGGDGLKVDASGHVWATGRDGINVFAPAGCRIGIINAGPAGHSNCAFGADGFLYITGGERLARVPVKARAISLQAA